MKQIEMTFNLDELWLIYNSLGDLLETHEPVWRCDEDPNISNQIDTVAELRYNLRQVLKKESPNCPLHF